MPYQNHDADNAAYGLTIWIIALPYSSLMMIMCEAMLLCQLALNRPNMFTQPIPEAGCLNVPGWGKIRGKSTIDLTS